MTRTATIAARRRVISLRLALEEAEDAVDDAARLHVAELAGVEEGAVAVRALLVVDVRLADGGEAGHALVAARALDTELRVVLAPHPGVTGIQLAGGRAAAHLLVLQQVEPESAAPRAAVHRRAFGAHLLHPSGAFRAFHARKLPDHAAADRRHVAHDDACRCATSRRVVHRHSRLPRDEQPLRVPRHRHEAGAIAE